MLTPLGRTLLGRAAIADNTELSCTPVGRALTTPAKLETGRETGRALATPAKLDGRATGDASQTLSAFGPPPACVEFPLFGVVHSASFETPETTLGGVLPQ
jgi:hypothetical protein